MTKKLEKHLEASIKLRRLNTNADHHMVPEQCELPPEIEALQHYAERVELDDAVERLSITTF